MVEKGVLHVSVRQFYLHSLFFSFKTLFVDCTFNIYCMHIICVSYISFTYMQITYKILNYKYILSHCFRRNRSTTSQILTIRRILEGVRAKNLQATLIFVDFTKAFDSIHRGKMEQILLAYGIPKETVAAITILY